MMIMDGSIIHENTIIGLSYSMRSCISSSLSMTALLFWLVPWDNAAISITMVSVFGYYQKIATIR